MRHILFLLFMALTLQAIAQYPATGNKMRLGWQTTGDGLVYRGAIGDTATLDPSGLNNAWMLLDTANGNLYAYRAKAWRLVSGGGGSVSDTLTGEVKGPLDSTYIDTVANIIFTTTTDTTVGVGELEYNDTQGSIQQGLKGGNVTNIIGQQLHQRVLNKTGSPLAKGEAVYLQGSQGNRITVAKAIATIDSTSANTFGIVAESIANNQSGYVITEGLITNMNTNTLTEGAAVYLSPTVAGGLTTTKPQAPDHGVYIGVCVKQHAGSGELFVKIRNGQELEELHDVRITSPASNASLYYNAAQGVWRDTGAAVLVADTSAMLTNYINVVDTAAMLTNYINIADTATMLSSYISNADTSVFARDWELPLKLNVSDTSVFARDFQISGTANRLAMFTGSNTVGNSWFSQSDSVMALNDTKKMQLYGRNGRRNYLEIFRNGTNTMQTNYVLATDTAYTASTGTTSRIYTHAVDNQNADYMISTYSGGGTGGFILLDALRTGIGTTTPAYRLDVNGDVNTTGVYKKSGTDIISGTTNYIPKFTGANTIGNSGFIENGQEVYLGGTTNAFNFSRFSIYYNPVNNGFPIVADTRAYNASPLPGAGWNFGGKKDSTGAYTAFGAIQGAKETSANSEAGYLQFSTNGDGGSAYPEERMRITSAGNVGIATSSPSRPLHVAGTTAIRIPVGTTAQRPSDGANGDIRYSTTFNNIEFYDLSRGLWERPLVGTVANNKVAFASGDTLTSNTNFHFDNTNTRLGIGNAAPDSTLTVTGGIRTTTSIRTGSDAIINGMTVGLGASNVASNLAFGNGALASWDTAGTGTNVAIGALALNAARGTAAFGASSNLAIGGNALRVNSNTANNVAIGADAMRLYNRTGAGAGGGNVAIGGSALYFLQASASTPVADNVAIGLLSMAYGINSDANVAIGSSAMTRAQGNQNIAIGNAALASSADGGGTNYRAGITRNTSIGSGAMQFATNNTIANTAIGFGALQRSGFGGDSCVYIGAFSNSSDTSADNEIVIGATAVGNGSNTTTIGNSRTTNTIIPAGSLTVDVMRRKAPVTVTDTFHTVANSTSWLICNRSAGSVTLTLPAASSWAGREIMIKTIQPQAVISASSNVVPIDGVATGTAILPATDGAWCTLVSDGTNWIIMQRGS